MHCRKFVLAIGVTLLVTLGSLSSPHSAHAETDENIDNVREEISTLPDPVAREWAEAQLQRSLSQNGKNFSLATAQYIETDGSTSPENRTDLEEQSGYPSGCGLTVLVRQVNNTNESSSLTSCGQAYDFLTMQSELRWVHGVTGVSEHLTGKSENYGPGTSEELTYSWTCNNDALTNYRTETRGALAQKGTEYQAAAFDKFDQNVRCGK